MEKPVIVEAAKSNPPTKAEVEKKHQEALAKIRETKKPSLEEYLGYCRQTYDFMYNRAREDALDPKKRPLSSACAFMKAYVSLDRYLEVQIEEYNKIIDPLTDLGYRAILTERTDQMFKNAYRMVDEYNGLRTNNAFAEQYKLRKKEFEDAAAELNKQNREVSKHVSETIKNDSMA